uniref:Uncharacterized protein n=1 Tax=Ixodes ricinus TaxID=34613 RepID=A0A6B0UEP0_IXORI
MTLRSTISIKSLIPNSQQIENPILYINDAIILYIYHQSHSFGNKTTWQIRCTSRRFIQNLASSIFMAVPLKNNLQNMKKKTEKEHSPLSNFKIKPSRNK